MLRLRPAHDLHQPGVSRRGFASRLLSHPLAGACTASAILLIISAEGICLLPIAVQPITERYFGTDSPWAIALGLILLAVAVGKPETLAWLIERLALRPGRSTAMFASAVAASTLIGTYVVFQNYGLTRDEAMAEFDAAIVRGGHLVQLVPAAWRPYTHALEPSFVLPIEDSTGWVSNYLPINAALRGLFSLVGASALAGPILAAVALVALGSVARRLWPTRPDATVVAALMLASSTQVLVTAMTPYAMTAHLAFDLVWLWLFLRNTRTSHAGAVAVGFFATGLHQLVFHPLFAMPFIGSLWLRRRFKLASLYTLAYAGICLFWIAYWQIMLRTYGLQGAPSAQAGSFLATVAALIATWRPADAGVMLMNLVRFATWQNPLLLPLLMIALYSVTRWNDTIRALAAGIAITVGLVFFVLPYQGHGWGYRYLHGLIGSFALIATQAYVELTKDGEERSLQRLGGAIVASSVFALTLMLPLRCIEARELVGPYAAAARQVRSSPNDIVFVDRDAMPYLHDIVRNAPDLSNRPLVFDLLNLDEGQIRALCAVHDVAVFDLADGRTLGLAFLLEARSEESLSRRSLMATIGCGHPLRERR